METYHRPSWDEYFLDVMHALAKRATCDRGRTACVIVKDTQAAKRGVSLAGATLYCKLAPCRTCAMLLIACGIKRIVAEYKYQAGSEAEAMLLQAGIQLEYVHNETLTYQKI